MRSKKKFLGHVCVVKLFDKAFFCFPLTENNLIALIFLFDCLDMKLNIPTCFYKTLFLHCRLFVTMLIYKLKEHMCRLKKILLHDYTT